MIFASFCSGSSGLVLGEGGRPVKGVKIAGAREKGFFCVVRLAWSMSRDIVKKCLLRLHFPAAGSLLVLLIRR